MRRLQEHLKNSLKHEDGPTAGAYTLLPALLIAVCVSAIATVGNDINETSTRAVDAPSVGSW